MNLSKNEDARLIAPELSPTIRYLDTTKAYDLWAAVYDTDGNFLQALDTLEMRDLVPLVLSSIQSPKPWRFVDLGCGTGRNSSALIEFSDVQVVGLDASPNMLAVAQKRITALPKSSSRLQLEVYDLLADKRIPHSAMQADGVISTLVLEHVPISALFAAVSRILKPAGVFLVTNMHADMGAKSQAGFVDPLTKVKVRPTSYAHEMHDVVAEAGKQRFQLIGHPLERAVDEDLVEKLGPRAVKWIGVNVWFGMLFRWVG